MSRSAWLAGTLAALAAGGTGYWAASADNPVPHLVERARTALAHLLPGYGIKPGPAPARVTGEVVYYQDPDGRPAYASEPARTPDGRDYRPVHAGEDIRFETEEPSAAAASEVPAAAKRIRYYRNPMGLPDTSPTPKKDGMGMDYLPVYEGEDADGSTVTISPGRIQRTGVRSERVERRILSRPVRAPGSIEEDERRIAVIAMRTDAFIEKVEAVTTGDHVRKGQPLLRLFVK